jgi:mono/diheme cytochrome c family protein
MYIVYIYISAEYLRSPGMRTFPLVAVAAALLTINAQAHAGDADAGKVKFQQLCAVCHGATGAGDGPAAAGLNPKPRTFGDAEWQAGVEDGYLRKIITEGGPAVGKSPMMTAQRGLKDEELENIIAYIRTLDD